MVCDSRYELTSKHPGKGREKGCRERESGGGGRMVKMREGREVRLRTIMARAWRGRGGEVDGRAEVRASSQVGVTERLVLVSSPAAWVLFSAEYQVFCTQQVKKRGVSLSI